MPFNTNNINSNSTQNQTSTQNQIQNPIQNPIQNLIQNPTQNKIQNLTQNQIQKTYLNSKLNLNLNNSILLKPRTETVVNVQILNSEISEGICPEIEILQGVYLCPSIVKVNNNHAITSILNTTEKSVKINEIKIKLEELNHISENNEYYNIRKISQNNFRPERLQQITQLLRIDHLNEEEKQTLIDICHEYNHIFHVKGDTLTHTNAIEHEIPTSSQTPINTKSYRYPQVYKEEVDRQIKKMLEDDIIEPSSSPWNSPVWVVPKKLDASGERKYRIVIDYRKLNEISIGDSYPLPLIHEILDQLSHAKYFSVIDLTSGFHQIKMSPKDAPKTAFSTPLGHFQFKRMPFGLRNAPSTFQRLMNKILSGIVNYRCFVYLDDIVIFGDTLEVHNKRLKEVFERISQFNLKIQPDKCEFLRKEVMYLGHLITENGVKPDPKKVTAVLNYPTPKTPKDIKGFLGLSGYYRRFIKNFSSLTQPLTQLLKKDQPFVWTSTQQNSFDILRKILTSEPLLQYPDFEKPFYLTTDASNLAIGSVLSQGNLPNDLPIAYASRTLNKAESNYSTTEKELLAIVWSVKHFRPYLYGRKFFILTDHKPLTWLFNVKDPGSRLVRWRLLLEEYTYKILYKPGKLNQNADALSRIQIQDEIENPINSDQLINSNEALINVTNATTYHDFLEQTKHTIIINNNIIETSEDILKNPNNIAIFISQDLEYHDKFLNKFKLKFDHSDQLKDKVQLGNIEFIKTDQLSIFYCIYKLNYWDSSTYEEIFNMLNKLKQILLENKIYDINIPKIGTNLDKLKWYKIRLIIRFVFKDSNISVKIHHNNLIEPKPEEIQTILKENHSNPISGHTGFHKTYNKIKQHYKWKNMKQNIKSFIKNCESCQKNKLVRTKNKKPMEITTTSSKPFERISLDIVGPLPLSESGNKFILTLQDDLTKFSQAYPIPNHEAVTIAKNLVENFICKFGIPDSILTDQGKDFTSKLLQEISKLFKIKQINCSAYHPQSNGALERSHLTLADYLKHYVNDKQTDWDNWLNFAMFSYNTSIHTSTKFSPFELIFGIKPNLPSSITRTPEFKYTYDDYVSELTLKLQKSHEIAKQNLIESKEKNKTYYDRNIKNIEFKVNDKVYLLNETQKPGHSKKLTQNYTGPYIITKINSPVNCTILVKNKPIVVHTNRLKHAFVSGTNSSY